MPFGLGANRAREFKQVALENARLKKPVAGLAVQWEVLSKMFPVGGREGGRGPCRCFVRLQKPTLQVYRPASFRPTQAEHT